MKKVKLFTTIASLCLAVALMAFGVYAATITDLKVKGTISFGATEVDGSWTELKVTVVNGTIDGQASKTYTEGFDSEIALPNIVVTDISKTMTITLEAKFNNTSNAVDATIGAASTVEEGTGYTLTNANTAGSAAKEEGTVVAAKVVYTFNVTDKAQSVSGIDFTATFSVTPTVA